MENEQDATAEPGDGAVTDIPSVSSIEVPDRETTDLPDDATDNSVSSTTQTASGENRPANSAARDDDNLTITQHETKIFQFEKPGMIAFVEGQPQIPSSSPVSSVSLENEGCSGAIEAVECYEMRTDAKKGVFLVFCHEQFENSNLTPLQMESTCRELQSTWEELGFIFRRYNDLTRNEIFEVINGYATTENEYGWFACTVMTHGVEEDMLWAYDSKYHLKKLYQPFEECKSLDGKPKLFFIEACRGIKRDYTTKFYCHGMTVVEKTIYVPKNADFFIAFATTEGFVAAGNIKYGSIFLRSLNHCIRNSASLDILKILTKVIQEVAEKNIVIGDGIIKQCPTILSRLTKQVVLRAPEQPIVPRTSVYVEQERRGIFLILLQTFDNGTVRESFEKNVNDLGKVLDKLGFEVHNELFKDEANIINILRRYTDDEDLQLYENRTCFGCVVLSVGVENYKIFSKNSRYHYKQMIQPFIECTAWKEKPKLFFVQANVNETMRSFSAQREPHPPKVSALSPEEADVLIMFSPDSPYEEPTSSPFITSLANCMWRYRNLDLLTILTKVVGEVARVETVSGQQYNLCPTIVSRLTKQFYLNG